MADADLPAQEEVVRFEIAGGRRPERPRLRGGHGEFQSREDAARRGVLHGEAVLRRVFEPIGPELTA